jgi:transcriptional regulator with GAF, ATPase, and Fis domain
MASQIQKNSNGLEKRVDYLREVAAMLLSEVKSLKPLRKLELDRGINFNEEMKNFEIYLIETALEKTGGSQIKAARLLKLNNTTLNAKIKRYGIRLDSLNGNGGFNETE